MRSRIAASKGMRVGTGYRADLDGASSWTGDLAPKPGDWFWDNTGTLCVRLPEPGGFARLAGWSVSGPKDAPTVTPSIRQSYTREDGTVREIWHGHLVNGEFRPC